MATINSPISVHDPRAAYGGGKEPPLYAGGGDSGGASGGESPDYGARLRRTRLGLVTGLSSVTMIFVALSSAFVVRRGMPTFDERSLTYTHDWLTLSLPVGLLLVNTALLLLSSITVELARRQMARRMALAPVESIPGVTLGRERNFPWLGVTIILGIRISFGPVDGLARVGCPWIRHHEDQWFVLLLTYWDARRPSGWGAVGAVVCGNHFRAA